MATIIATRCSGGAHFILTVTEAWGTHRIAGEATALVQAARTRSDRDLLEDVKKVIKDAGAVTPQQMKVAIEAATYQDTDNTPDARDFP